MMESTLLASLAAFADGSEEMDEQLAYFDCEHSIHSS